MDFQTVFTIAILDNRNDNSILHAARFLLDEVNGIWASLEENLSKVYNENDGTSDEQQAGAWLNEQTKGVAHLFDDITGTRKSVADIFIVNEDNWASIQENSVDDLHNGNNGSWADLLNQSVDDTVKNMFRELFSMKNLPGIRDNLIGSGDLLYWWIVKDDVFEITNDVVGGSSLADLIGRIQEISVGDTAVFVTCLLTLK